MLFYLREESPQSKMFVVKEGNGSKTINHIQFIHLQLSKACKTQSQEQYFNSTNNGEDLVLFCLMRSVTLVFITEETIDNYVVGCREELQRNTKPGPGPAAQLLLVYKYFSFTLAVFMDGPKKNFFF